MTTSHHTPTAVIATLCFEMLRVAKIDQRVQIFDSFNDNVTAFTAVATIRPAKFNVLFAPHGYRPSTAVARFDVYLCFIKKFHNDIPTAKSTKGATKISHAFMLNNVPRTD